MSVYKVLVVEDSPMVMKIIRHVMSSSQLFECTYVESLAAAKQACESQDFFAALVDLNLPDAPNGEVVDYTLSLGIPSVVLTGSFDEEKRSKLLAKGIVDYVTKEGRFSYEYALGVLTRLVKNQCIKVLVVDDSETARNFVSQLLRLHLYQVMEASDGVHAIKIILENPDLKLLITDYNMPRMDGCELVKKLRLKYEKSHLVIIGLSSESEGTLSARFIKNGANDFLRKPFNHEEFYCRVTHNVEFLELIETIQDAANRDDLTGAYNRRYFFKKADDVISSGKHTVMSAAIVDLDGFRQINDLWGQGTGDEVIQAVASEFEVLFERFTFARAGGKEFYVLLPGLDNEKALAFVERVRQILCSEPLNTSERAIAVTFSAGVASLENASIDNLMAAASQSLHRAKEAGGDLVFGDDED